MPPWIAHLRTKTLIVGIAGAVRIAVRQQEIGVVDGCRRRIDEQDCVGGLGERGPEQQVAIAVHEKHAQTGSGEVFQRAGHALREKVGQIVVTGPVFEQVAEDDEFAMVRGDVTQEAQKRFEREPMIGTQVQIGNEDGIDERDSSCRRCQCRRPLDQRRGADHAGTSSARSMTTSCSGTS